MAPCPCRDMIRSVRDIYDCLRPLHPADISLCCTAALSGENATSSFRPEQKLCAVQFLRLDAITCHTHPLQLDDETQSLGSVHSSMNRLRQR